MTRESLFATPPASPSSAVVNYKDTDKEDAQSSSLTVISAEGDLILRIKEDDDREGFLYRVESGRLRAASSYFEKLLSPRFNEGANVAAQHDRLRKQYAKMAEAPAEELPEVTIIDIGRISKVSSIKVITGDFLRALHDQSLGRDAPPIPNIANLTIVADRFDALPTFSQYMQRRKYLQIVDAKAKGKNAASLTEERVRQKLLVGVMLDYDPWVRPSSKRLIITGSARWKGDVVEEPGAALWWDIPTGIEDELIFRRQCILETITSVQSHFLKLYTSGQRQCRLGYDSSAQCDVYQLGEMIRFFTRIGTLRLVSAISGSDSQDAYNGDINRLVESLRQCQSYQIDTNHSHCGLRTKLIPLLDHMQSFLGAVGTVYDIGICGECWRERRAEYAWARAKRPVIWSLRISPVRISPREQHSRDVCLGQHAAIRDLFTAVEHDWTMSDQAQGRAFGTWMVDRKTA